MVRNSLFAAAALFSGIAYGLTVDTIFLVADKNGNGIVTLTNDLDKPSFIKTSIDEIKTDAKGGLIRTAYTKDNLSQWRIMTTHPKLILEPGREKEVGVRSMCNRTQCESDHDMVFSVTFAPSPYLKKGEQKDEQAVQINYGYSVVYVIPTKQGKMAYRISRNKNMLEVFNQGNTMLSLVIDECSETDKVQCRMQEHVINGRLRSIKLPEKYADKTVKAKIYNHDGSYKRELLLTPEFKS